ncbi:hypothetical protein BCR32DRAFT_299932 [Anaeromyces robustus]|uniref:Right handed beta helix domain-containing protein n=1 Tax=Anaeromyces robustus TaxID=1754192 RepID=A0A1Y1X4A9_9FUNG|nr:hypothetical protein BCR32DRAFT_299932 [Anaeromyces robustus]|eukprot:ORX80651.1 hypothetical protein BCR32DRAFT_299932 [Anaeromyces robustus]
MIYFKLKTYKLLFFLLIWLILKCQTIDIYIPNDQYDIDNINELINTYSQKYKTINIYFNTDYYYSKPKKERGYELTIPEKIDVALIGNPVNGTTFIDLTEFSFYYSIVFVGSTIHQFKVENITFYNFNDPVSTTVNDIFYVNYKSNKFNLLFKNCIFDGSNSLVLDLHSTSEIYQESSNFQVLFDSCQFKNIKGNGVIKSKRENSSNYCHLNIIFSNSVFDNCYNILDAYCGDYLFDNCIFNNISSYEGYSSFAEINFNSSLTIKNSIINNSNNLNPLSPFIKSYGNLINFNNVTMINIHNDIGYIIEDNGQVKYANKIIIDNSYFEDISPLINGKKIKLFIDNSEFKNISNTSSYSLISNIVYGENYLNNSKISDIKLYGTTLLNDDSPVKIENSEFTSISTFYKPVFQISYNDIVMKNININNINIYGDNNECNLLSLLTGDKEKDIILQNINITNIKSNDKIINIKGNNANIKFNNIKVDKSISYGPFLKCDANNITLHLDNMTFINSKNLKKDESGIFHLENNININILNSEFFNNESHSFGIM